MDIVSWLGDLNLARYAETFRDNEIGMDILPDLTEADLSDLNIPLGDRKRIMRGISAFADTPEVPFAKAPPAEVKQEAERRHLTVMFVDLVDSTRIASELDPEEMRDLIRAYQNAVAGEVSRFNGYVAKFMGDGVLCYFGFPAANENDTERAVRAGMAIIGSTAPIRTARGEQAKVRIGIATGIVVVGEITGEAEVRERDVVGETPNIAARLQSVAKPGQIVLSDKTQELVRQVFQTSEISLPPLKGISSGMRAYLAEGETTTDDLFAAAAIEDKSPFVGREAEMDRLLHGWAKAEGGGTGAALLTGEAGIGKSRIVQSFAHHLSSLGHPSFTLHCSPYHAQTALHPITSLIEKEAGVLASDTDDQALVKLKRLLPDMLEKSRDAGQIFANLMGRDFDRHFGPTEMAPQQLRARTITHLVEFLLTSSGDLPHFIIIEDIHWIDQTTTEVLIACMTAFASHNTYFLFAGRSDGIPSSLEQAIEDKMTLPRLDHTAVCAIIADMTQGKAFPGELVEEIYLKTDGVPLFVQELTKTIIESEQVEETDTEFRLTGPINSHAIPSSLHDSLMARLDRLQYGKKTAQIAACIGRTFDLEILAEVLPQNLSDQQNALDELISVDLVSQPDGASSLYSFRHALVCDAAYESLLKSKRREIHGSIAQHMQRQSAPPSALAYHLEMAGQPISAAECLLSAGRDALRFSATTEAINRFQKGVSLLETLPPTSETKLLEMRLWGMLGSSYMLTKSWGAEEVDQAYSRALELVDETDDLNERIWVIWGAWVFQQVHGHVGSSQKEARRAMEITLEAGNDDASLIAHLMMMQASFYEGRWRDALKHGVEIERLYDAERHGSLKDAYSLDLLLVWYVHGSQAQWMLGEFQKADELRAKALKFAASVDHTYSRVWVDVWAANLDLLNGDVDNILRVVPEAIQLSETHGYDYIARLGQLLLTSAHLSPGADFDIQSFDGLDAAIEHFQATGAGITIPYFLALKARAQLMANRPLQARATCSDALEIIEEKGERWVEPFAHRIMGDILSSPAIGDQQGAKDAYLKVVDCSCTDHALVWQVQAEIGLYHQLVDNGEQAQAQKLRRKLTSCGVELERKSGLDPSAIVKELVFDLSNLGETM